MLGRTVLLWVSVWLVCANGLSIKVNDADTKQWRNSVQNVLEEGVLKFTLDLDKQIDRKRAQRKDNTPNSLLSPLNLINTFAMIFLGALGTTNSTTDAFDLKHELPIVFNSEIVYWVLERLIDNVCVHEENSPKPFITTSTAVFSQTDHPIRSQFKTASRFKQLHITELNMNPDPDKATDQIKQWLHKRMLPGMDGYFFSPLTSTKSDAAIASTLNFNGTRHIMKLKSVKKEPFMISPIKSVLVDMVYTEGHGRYYRDEELDMEIIELPYNPDPNEDYNYMGRTSIYILKPLSKDPDALTFMKSRLTPKIIKGLLGELMYMYIDLRIPTMNLSSTLNLKRELVSMGVSLFDRNKSKLGRQSKNFQDSSDNVTDFESPGQFFMEWLHGVKLKNLSVRKKLTNPGMVLSHFLHKVNMEFTETGTKASSATVAQRRRSDDESYSSDLQHRTKRALLSTYNLPWREYGVMEVNIDRPFLFFIKHYPTNLTLFWGTVNDPTFN